MAMAIAAGTASEEHMAARDLVGGTAASYVTNGTVSGTMTKTMEERRGERRRGPALTSPLGRA